MVTFRVLLLTVIFACAGCTALFGKRAEQTFFVLPAHACAKASTPPRVNSALMIQTMGASPFYNNQRLVYSDSPGTRSYYRLSLWVETPADALTGALRRKIECANLFTHIQGRSTAASADYLLNTRLVDFYIETAAAPPVAHLVVEAELVDLRTRVIRDTHLFSEIRPASSSDIAAFVVAFGEVADDLSAHISDWLGRLV